VNAPQTTQTALSPDLETIPTPESSYLAYLRYDPKGLRLEVGFKYGGIVQHWPVYPQTWLDMKVHPSKGKFYHAVIKLTSQPIKIK
jgi:hypothetical protein